MASVVGAPPWAASCTASWSWRGRGRRTRGRGGLMKGKGLIRGARQEDGVAGPRRSRGARLEKRTTVAPSRTASNGVVVASAGDERRSPGGTGWHCSSVEGDDVHARRRGAARRRRGGGEARRPANEGRRWRSVWATWTTAVWCLSRRRGGGARRGRGKVSTGGGCVGSGAERRRG